jgi:uncharacterized protein YndB with AHSA1/START domain
MFQGLRITTPSDTEIVMTRQFNAPRRLVWDAMTEPELIRRWLFLPPGWTMVACEEDVRIGGKYRWAWNGPDGKLAMTMSGTYREVVPPERAVRTERFDMAGAPAGGEQVCTLSFAEQGGITTMTIRVVHQSKANRDAALASGMEQGMNAGYANLDELLAAAI